VHWPYTTDFLTSFFAAQSCAGLMLTALVLFWRFGSPAARGAMLGGIWLAVLALAIPAFAASVGYQPGPQAVRLLLESSAALGTLAALLALRPVVTIVALLGQVALWWVSGYVKDSDGELGGLFLGWLGLILGLLLRGAARPAPAAEPPPVDEDRSYALHDVVVFTTATALASLVCLLVMRKRDGTADEWAYTYQAAVFAKGHVFAQSPRCQPYLQNFYVFESSGRLFSQYTPGWPFFLAPFVWIRAVWLAGPVAMGLMSVGIAMLSRRAARSLGSRERLGEGAIAAAGSWGAALATLGTTVLILAASRYPHVFVTALYAWSLEALFTVSTPGVSRARQLRWGCVLGSAAALMLATRPAEGATLGLGIAVVFVVALARGRVGWRAMAATTAAFAFWGGLSLVILRVQLGKWFETGYALNAVIYPWNVVKYSWPLPNQWKYELPLATGAYCWWPCSVALGLAGLALVRGRMVAALAVGELAYEVLLQRIDVGQRGGFDWGYGPRYLLVLVVPMAVGGAVALAPLAIAAFGRTLGGRRALVRGGPLALALTAIAAGWLRIVPLVWPTAADHVRRHAGLQTAIDAMHLRNAVVMAAPGTTGFDPFDLTTNLPIDLYPDQDVIIAIDRSPDAVACMRAAYPSRRFYRAAGVDDVRITPY
jgi:hypothetical protein